MRNGRLILIVLIAAMAFIALTLLPIGHRSAAYRAADSVTDTRDDLILVNVPRFDQPPLFRIENGRLYLLVEDLRHALMLTTMSGSEPHWDAESLAQFRAAHPELEQYWPKPNQADAGLAWLGKRY